jgi:hypothetical protein
MALGVFVVVSFSPNEGHEVGLTANLVSQFFSREYCGKMRLASRENISASLASLTSLKRREKCDIL